MKIHFHKYCFSFSLFKNKQINLSICINSNRGNIVKNTEEIWTLWAYLGSCNCCAMTWRAVARRDETRVDGHLIKSFRLTFMWISARARTEGNFFLKLYYRTTPSPIPMFLKFLANGIACAYLLWPNECTIAIPTLCHELTIHTTLHQMFHLRWYDVANVAASSPA